MKLIATLATLAALVGQTEATLSATAVDVISVEVGNAPCTDVVVLKATSSEALASGETMKFSSTKLSTKKTLSADLQKTTAGTTTTTCFAGTTANAGTSEGDATGHLSAVAATEVSGVTTWTWTVATGKACASGIVKVTLQNVCNNGVTDYNGANIGLKYTAVANDVKESAQAAGTALLSAGNNNVKKLADFTVVDMPVAANTTGPFKATWTGVAALNTLKLVLNLPKDYTIPSGSTCNITKTGGSPVTLRASTVGATTSTTVFGTAVSTLDATKTTLNCDKVKSGATIAANVDDAVSVKAHASGSPNVNTHVAYAVANTPKPTAKPTAKAADSPASVATASGVVVGALGVAALFLA